MALAIYQGFYANDREYYILEQVTHICSYVIIAFTQKKVAQVLGFLVLGLLIFMLLKDIVEFNDTLAPYSMALMIGASCIILFLIHLILKLTGKKENKF